MKTMVLTALTVLMFSGMASAANWWETIKVKGDLRYRHEMIDKADSDARHRQRVRVRLGIYGEVNQFMKAGVQLATGSDDPVSTNQTLDGSFSTKGIGVDLAYFEAKTPALPGVVLKGGKFKNPFYKPGKSELLWDSDLNPEGGTVSFTHELDKVTINLIGAGLWIDERSSGKDSWMGAAQGVLKVKLDDKSSFAFGGAYFNYVNAEGFGAFYDDDFQGNSTSETVDMIIDDDDDTTYVSSYFYANDYDLLELYGEFTHNFNQMPVTVMGDYVTNTAADSVNTGWLVGVRLGKAKKPGSWAFRYIYREVEKDAVVGNFTDSDFRGGGTDARGHEFGGSLVLARNAAFNASYFLNKTGLDAEEADFNRMQLDLQLKF